MKRIITAGEKREGKAMKEKGEKGLLTCFGEQDKQF